MKYFCEIYHEQTEFQRILVDTGMYGDIGRVSLPEDKLDIFSYHVQAMIAELGEVLNSDERWKTHRNEWYSKKDKLTEIADCFLTLMNIAIFSGYKSYEVEEAIENKIKENVERLKHEQKINNTLAEWRRIAEEWEVE